jgi:predicted XRE-type DNA-binding protein
MKKNDDSLVESGSDNIFSDIGIPDAEVHMMKAQMVLSIRKEIDKRNLTQEQAGKIMGITQSKLSLLLNGRFRNCTIDRLIRYLARLDKQVQMTIVSLESMVNEG